MTSKKEMPKNYDLKNVESFWMNKWVEDAVYSFSASSGDKVFTIDTPPPTVSGKMHIGHSFSYSHEDFIARFKRMRGFKVFYPFGTDDNGLPTDKLVEKTRKIRSKDYSREEYLDICFDTIESLRPDFILDWKRLGMSCDFSNSYSTISKEVQKISQKAFIDLYKKGLLYRKETPVSWCPTCRTAIAQAEFENVEMTSHFNDIVFKSGADDLVVATTRPELLPACVALFYNPGDSRYTHLKGKFARVPLFDYEVPILTDDSVDMDKGTGLMMCCTFGDKDDIEKWYNHKLPLRIAFTPDGKLNSRGGPYEGLTIRDAREKIISDLESAGLLLASKPITHAVNVHERCGTEVEYIHTSQWFISILDHKEELIELADKINWHPEHMKARYVHWVKNLNWDWCISRQRHFGIPFPVWYEKDSGNIILADEDQLPVDPLTSKPKNYDGDPSNLVPEKDVMDTWATSSLTPMIALSWLSNPEFFKSNFPMSLRPQAHDIIRTWAFYTIVRAFYHENNIPWNDIMISGFVLDPKGNKMSKSRGNTVSPQVMIEKYGADALRYWAAGSKLGEDIPFMEKDLQTGKKTVNKLWNASRFALMHLSDFDSSSLKDFSADKLYLTDKWLLSKLQNIIRDATIAFENYEFSKSKLLIDNFFWNVFCDYYLEIIKERLYNPDAFGVDKRLSAQFTLYKSLNAVLKLFAPILPFVTEEIYQYSFASDEGFKSIHLSSWPEVDDSLIDDSAESIGDKLVAIVSHVRKAKSSANLSLKAPLKKLVIECSDKDKALFKSLLIDLKGSTRAEVVEFSKLEVGDEIADGLKVSLEFDPVKKD